MKPQRAFADKTALKERVLLEHAKPARTSRLRPWRYAPRQPAYGRWPRGFPWRGRPVAAQGLVSSIEAGGCAAAWQREKGLRSLFLKTKHHLRPGGPGLQAPGLAAEARSLRRALVHRRRARQDGLAVAWRSGCSAACQPCAAASERRRSQLGKRKNSAVSRYRTAWVARSAQAGAQRLPSKKALEKRFWCIWEVAGMPKSAPQAPRMKCFGFAVRRYSREQIVDPGAFCELKRVVDQEKGHRFRCVLASGWGPHTARCGVGCGAKPCGWVQRTALAAGGLGEAVRPGATPLYPAWSRPTAKNTNERALARAV